MLPSAVRDLVSLLCIVLACCNSCSASLSWHAHGRRSGSRALSSTNSAIYANSSLDDPTTRTALLSIYNATSGPTWSWVNLGNSSAALGLWGDPGLSYCLWFGVECCATTPMSPLVACDGDRAVATLTMDSFGMRGSLPAELGNLTQLAALGLGQNPGLVGQLPGSVAKLTQLLWLSVEVRTPLLSTLHSRVTPRLVPWDPHLSHL